MATRNAIHILRNTLFPSQVLPASAYLGEPLVNLGDGIMFFSGSTAGSPTWVPAGTGNTANYFEVGSNLYNLKLRNQITHYNGLSNLSGKFLSGTTNGFVLADISSIASSTNTYVTGGTWNPNTLILGLNDGSTTSPIIIDSFNNLNLYGTTNVNGDLNVTGTTGLQGVTATNINVVDVYVTGTEIVNNLTITGTGLYNSTATLSNEIVNYGLLTSYTQNNDVYVTGNTYNGSNDNSNSTTFNLLYHGIPLNGPYTLTSEDTYTTGGTYSNATKQIIFTRNDSTTFPVDLSAIDVNDTYVTGGTNNAATDFTNSASIGLKYNQDIPDGTYSLPYTNTYVTGGTYNAGTINLTRNDGVIIPINGLQATDIYVTGFTYTAANNSLVISRNQGQPDLPVYINSFSGLTISNLTPGQVVYAGTGGELKTDSTGEFAYDDSTNTLTIGTTTGNLIVNNPSGTTAIIGQGGLVIGSGGSHVNPGIGDLTVHGNFTVFGTGTTIATNELYIEDPTITLNYNPSGSSTSTSIGSGIVIQDGSGTIGTDTTLRIGQLYLNSNFTPNAEYTSATGNANRGFFTQLNDIIVRNTNNNAGVPDGKRLLAEDDILDGGTY